MASEASDRETAGHAWSRPLDPADKEGERPTIFLPSGKKYKGEWSRNKMNGARRTLLRAGHSPPPRRGAKFALALTRPPDRFPQVEAR